VLSVRSQGYGSLREPPLGLHPRPAGCRGWLLR
jgi:hypothetical protein